jgi:predicted amidohydrolase
MMKIGLCQTSPKLGDVEFNLSEMIRIMEEYQGKADLLVFPELSLTGYDLKEKLYDVALTLDSAPIRKVSEASKKTKVSVVFGFVEQGMGEQIYNSAILIKNGEISSVQQKIYPTNYGIFEEGKYFSRGKKVKVDTFGPFNTSMLICNDLWHPSLPHIAAHQHASLLIGIINSPKGGIDKNYSSDIGWVRVGQFYASIYGCYVVLVNRVGKENDLEFYGSSKLFDPYGEIIAQCPIDEASIVITEINEKRVKEVRKLLPTMRDEDVFLTSQHYQWLIENTN